MSVLNINVYNNGVVSVNGSGTIYDDFYKWQRTLVSSVEIKVNWPNHYFILNSATEYKEMFSKYKKYIKFTNVDYV